jgi:hypothetical protein
MKNPLLVFLAIACLLFAPAAFAQETTGGTEAAPSGDGTVTAPADAMAAPADSTGTAPAADATAPAGAGTTDAAASTDSTAAGETTAAPAGDATAPADASAPADTTATSAETTSAEGTAAPTEPAATENGNVEEALAQEVSPEEQQAIATDLEAEAKTIDVNLPGGFSRFLAGLGDAFTFDKKGKAKRAMARMKENKLRILQRMYDTQTGLARSKKFAPEVQKLMEYINQDAQKAEQALADTGGSTEADLQAVGELNEAVAEQEVLDGMIAQEAKETVEASTDLASGDIQQLNTVAGALETATEKVKGKAKSEELKVAGKLLAKGKSLQDVKKVREKAVKRKEARAKTTKAKEMKAAGKAKAETKAVGKAKDAGMAKDVGKAVKTENGAGSRGGGGSAGKAKGGKGKAK